MRNIRWGAACFLGLAACGGSGSGAAGLNTGVAGGTVLSQASAADRSKICQGVEDWGKATFSDANEKKLECRGEGYEAGFSASSGEAVAACTSAENACLAEWQPSSEPGGNGPTKAECEAAIASTTCVATVAEMEACTSEIAANINTMPTCTAAFGSGTRPTIENPTQGPACQTMFGKCPTLAGDSGDPPQ